MKEDKLSLDEVLQLVNKVTNWEKKHPLLSDFSSSVESLSVEISKMGFLTSFLFSNSFSLKPKYEISVMCGNVFLGIYNNNNDKRFIELYERVKQEYEKKQCDERKVILQYARNMLKNDKEKIEGE